MSRLTTSKPVEEMNMLELAHNACYAKEGEAWYRDFERDLPARDYARNLMYEYMNWDVDDIEIKDNAAFDESMYENLAFGDDTTEGLIALLYRNLWAMANVRERLKQYEDAEEQGLLLRLPFKVGDIAYCAWDVLSIPKKDIFKKSIKARVTKYEYSGANILTIVFEPTSRAKEDHTYYCFEASSIGKNIFRTKEAAEAALQAMQEGKE